MPPRTTKRRTTTNIKTNKQNNQNCQKIELYGSLTTNELKKTHSSRRVGGADTGRWAERTCSKVVAGGPSEVADYGVRQARQQLADPARWWLVERVVPH